MTSLLQKMPRLSLAGAAGIIFEHSPIKCFGGGGDTSDTPRLVINRFKDVLAALGQRNCKVIVPIKADVAESLNDDRVCAIGLNGEVLDKNLRASVQDAPLLIILADILSAMDRMGVRGFLDGRKNLPPCIVVHGMLQPDNEPTANNLKELHATVEELMALGADDVITLQPRGRWLTHALEMSLLRMEQAPCRKCAKYESEMQRILAHVIDGSFLNFPPIDDAITNTEKLGNIGGWTITTPIGKGRYGRVFQAKNESTDRVDAVKVIMKADLKTSDDWLFLYNEHETLKKLGDHPNITTLMCAMQSETCVYFAMELAHGQDLFEVMKKKRSLAPEAVVRIFASISSALAHCHLHATCHRDLKPENVVVQDNYEAKLIDFGCACPRSELQTQCVGSLPFIAPEFLIGTALDGAPADVWSFGVLLLEMVFGLHALSKALSWHSRKPTKKEGNELMLLFADPVKGLERVRSALGISNTFEGDDLLAGMLHSDPAKRPTADTLCESPWVKLSQPEQVIALAPHKHASTVSI